MAVLSHIGKPLQAQDTLFMTEWVAIFRESGLRDDVSVVNLREACLQLTSTLLVLLDFISKRKKF